MAEDFGASPRTLGTILRRLVDHLDSAVEDAYYGEGLDYRPRFTPIVRALGRFGPCSMQTLVSHMGVSQSAVSQTVAEMTRKRLIVTRRDPADGRTRIVALSSKAKAMLPRLQACWDATELASATLDDELGQSLPFLIDRVLQRLAEKPMRRRIREARIQLGAPAND